MANDKSAKFETFFDNLDLGEDSDYDLGDDNYRLDEDTGEFGDLLGESKTSNDLKTDESKDAVAEDEESSEASDGDDSSLGIEEDDPVAKSPKFKKLESSLDSLLDVVEKLTQHVVKGKSMEQEETDDFDFSEPEQFKSSLKKMIQQSIQEAIAPMQQTTKEVQLKSELASLQAAHKDFADYVPAIKAVLEINPNMSLTDAFDNAKKIRGTVKQTTPSDSDTKQKEPQVKKEPVKKSAADLVQKAANIETVSGVSAQAKEKKRASNFNDALDQTFEQLGLK